MTYNSRQPAKEEKVTPAASTPAASGGNKDSDIRISAIEENNQLMIQATPVEWDSIESAIKKLDVVPLQVQIEARVLEVQLSGALQYGVQWWFAGLQGQSPRYANGDPYRRDYDRHQSLFGAAGPGQGGNIFWSYLNKNFEVALSALESKGQAKALAAPSLLVANNQEAQINVGTQLPVVQQYVTGLGIGTTNSGNAVTPGYGSVQYLNTGVTLAVTPRVNPGGLVYLDVQQEVSSPGIKAANGNPQINQRQLQTQVAVQSGETLLLGGLIQETSHVTDTGVPFLNRVPILRNLFGSTDTARDRTELIVLITPRVISTVDEARAVTADYARQFESLKPLRPTFAPKPAAQAAPPEPAQTYPAHDDAKPQEDHPNDN
jgi:general secretion pathway protein D